MGINYKLNLVKVIPTRWKYLYLRNGRPMRTNRTIQIWHTQSLRPVKIKIWGKIIYTRFIRISDIVHVHLPAYNIGIWKSNASECLWRSFLVNVYGFSDVCFVKSWALGNHLEMSFLSVIEFKLKLSQNSTWRNNFSISEFLIEQLVPLTLL